MNYSSMSNICDKKVEMLKENAKAFIDQQQPQQQQQQNNNTGKNKNSWYIKSFFSQTSQLSEEFDRIHPLLACFFRKFQLQ